MKKTILLLTLSALALLAGPPTGKRVASFTLPDSTGKYYDVLDFRGKPLLIEIMKTECAHCQTFSKTLERVKTRYGDRIAILSVVNPPDDPPKVANYVAKFKVSTPILFDFGQATAAMLKITPQNPSINLPHLLVVDANGIVQNDWPFSDAQKAIFEGDGLFAIVDKMLAAKK
ncbi:MAG TPA: TlpA disulfide reductase family protein [Paludibaculum sp.]|jgi:thiol-disulfide isomerase/thioredoxin